MRHEIFGSSDESENSSRVSNRSRTHSYDASEKHEDFSHRDDTDDSSRSHRSRSNPSGCGDRSTSIYVGTTQEEQDCHALRSAPENKPWVPSLSNMREWYGYTTESCRIPLLNSSRLHCLNFSAKNYCTEHDYYIDVFFRHRWYHSNRKRDELSYVQAWNSFIGNIENACRKDWLDKLDVARNRSEQKSHTGTRYKLHRLSREAGLPCLSRGEKCLSCVDSSVRAPREAYLPNQPYCRTRISSEMQQGFESLQSLYERIGRSYDDGQPLKGVSRRIARRDRSHPSSPASGAPSCSTRVDTPSTGQGNSSLILNRHGGSRYAPQGRVAHRGSPPYDVEEE